MTAETIAVVVIVLVLIALQGTILRAAVALERLADAVTGEVNTRNMERAHREAAKVSPIR